MRSIIKYLAVLAILLTLCSAVSATKVVRSGYELKLYTDTGVYKSKMVLPGLLDYEFKNNVVYTITASQFRSYNVANPATAIQTFSAKGNYWDIDLVSGTQYGSLLLATGKGMQLYPLSAATNWKPKRIGAVYKPALTIKAIDADSGGVKVYALNGERFQYVWKSDGFLIITDAWF